MDKVEVPGAAGLAGEILDVAYAQGIQPGFAQELAFDHGTMIPLKFLTPAMDVPVVPIIFNTLAPPQPSPASCFALGRVVGEVARASGKRIGIVATGGMSHDPGERNHGFIDEAFDRRFLELMAAGDADALQHYSVAELAAAGAGALELLGWIALAGALGEFRGDILAYEAVKPWATGMGLMRFNLAA
jgi:aromatic ring-opening dioxygenase catalytic subunit (LigB family)